MSGRAEIEMEQRGIYDTWIGMYSYCEERFYGLKCDIFNSLHANHYVSLIYLALGTSLSLSLSLSYEILYQRIHYNLPLVCIC